MLIAAGAGGCADESDDFVGDRAEYRPPVDLTEQALLCPPEPSGVFNNASSPFRWGEEEVRVQVDVAVDYRCPACLHFELLVQRVWASREQFRKYARLYFHHLPLEHVHHGTTEIHVAAAAAAEQDLGHFWALHDIIFDQATESRQMTREQVDRFLEQERGLDMEAYDRAMRSDTVRDFVQWDKQQIVAAGATGTPSLFICGEKALYWTRVEQLVDEALTGYRL